MIKDLLRIEPYRIVEGVFASKPGNICGCYIIPFENNTMDVIASDGEYDQWEHVSVSMKNRCPNWREMSFIKDLFWRDDEIVIQIHPQKEAYMSNHKNCLHLWRNKKSVLELPSSFLRLINPEQKES